MAEDVLDLYGDLTLNADGQLEPSASEYKEENIRLRQQIEQLQGQMDKQTQHNELLMKKVEILERNISVLYRTAAEEIKRKDAEIKKLRGNPTS